MEVFFLLSSLDYGAHFPEVEYHFSILNLIFFGLTVGIMTGFWGMGGRFLMTPLLNIFFNIPYNVGIGSDLSQMVGTSSMNMVKFRILGTVDYKLASWIMPGAIAGVECGVRVLQFLKFAPDLIIMGRPLRIMLLALSAIYAAVLFWIGTILYRESKISDKGAREIGDLTDLQMDMTQRLQTIHVSPMISLPGSGIRAVSLWVVLGVGFLTGFLVGFLGVGGSFIVLPALIYILGCPMGVARSTDLFAGLFIMAYGTISHSLRRNIDLILVIVLFLSCTLGIQIGTFLAKRFEGSRIRRAFAFVAYAVVFGLALKIFWNLGFIPDPF
jgi:hypothetical protein